MGTAVQTLPADGLARRMIEAAHQGDLPALRLALEDGAEPGACGEDGELALVQAARYGHHEVVEYLLRHAPHVLNLPDICQQTALITASRAGQLAVVELLLKAGADPRLTDERGQTALHHAAWQDQASVVAALLAHDPALVDLPGEGGATALSEAVSSAGMEAMDVLLAQGANAYLTNHAGWHPLEIAASNGTSRVALRLVAHDSGLLEHPGCAGGTALIAACEGNPPPSLALALLARGADPLARTTQGSGVLEAALERGHWELIEPLLVAAPALWDRPLRSTVHVEPADKGGPGIPLTGEACLTELLIERGHTLFLRELLRAHPERINAPGARGATPLMWAAAGGRKALVRWLLAQGADPSATDAQGDHALIYALNQRHLACAQLLLEHSPDLTHLPGASGASPQQSLRPWKRPTGWRDEALAERYAVQCTDSGMLVTTVPAGAAPAPPSACAWAPARAPERFSAYTLARCLAAAHLPRAQVAGIEAFWGACMRSGWMGGVLLRTLDAQVLYLCVSLEFDPIRTAYLLGPKTLAYSTVPSFGSLAASRIIWQDAGEAFNAYLTDGYLPHADQAAAVNSLIPPVPAGFTRYFTGYRTAEERVWDTDLAGLVLPMRELLGEAADALEYLDIGTEAVKSIPWPQGAELTESFIKVLARLLPDTPGDSRQIVPRDMTVADYLARAGVAVARTNAAAMGAEGEAVWRDAKGNRLIRQRLQASRARLSGDPVSAAPDLLPPPCTLPTWWDGGRSTEEAQWAHLGYACSGCGVCTDHLKEYYFVHKRVWRAAGLAYTSGCLCIGCLEQALGRTLTVDDFTHQTVEQADWDDHYSTRLLARMGRSCAVENIAAAVSHGSVPGAND